MPFIVKIKKQLALYELTVDLETEAGILAVIGGSGSGKSMTLKCIAGIETPDSGFISLNGRVLYDSSKKINLPPQTERRLSFSGVRPVSDYDGSRKYQHCDETKESGPGAEMAGRIRSWRLCGQLS